MSEQKVWYYLDAEKTRMEGVGIFRGIGCDYEQIGGDICNFSVVLIELTDGTMIGRRIGLVRLDVNYLTYVIRNSRGLYYTKSDEWTVVKGDARVMGEPDVMSLANKIVSTRGNVMEYVPSKSIRDVSWVGFDEENGCTYETASLRLASQEKCGLYEQV